MTQNLLLRIDEATVRRGDRRILDNISMEIPEGCHTAVVGANGSGKTTLIRLITRQHYPLARPDDRPVVTIFGKDRWNVFDLRAMMGIVSSDLDHDFVADAGILGLDAVLSGFFASKGLARNHRITADMRNRARQALADAEAENLAAKPMEEMSTGEARRVLIARALVASPRALLLDEPTTGLDMVARSRFLATLRRLAVSGRTILLVTHHIEEILPEIDHVILLKHGKVHAAGTKESTLTSESLSSAFAASVEVRRSGDWYSAEAALTENMREMTK
ncbi:MAG: ABC transporter ATP-binding protein [Capsulimonadaceae bacterium]